MKTITEIEDTEEPRSVGYVDDNFITITKQSNITLQETLNRAVIKIGNYMANNRLHLNTDNTKMMIITSNPAIRKDTILVTDKEIVKHSNSMKILGLEISHDLNWKYFLNDSKQSLLKQLRTRINALSILKRTTPDNQMKMYADGIFSSKLFYGAEIWGGAPGYIIKKIKHLQLDAARLVNGPKATRWSATTLLKSVNWLSIDNIAKLTSAKLTQKILTTSQPEEIAHRIMRKIDHTRLTRRNGPFMLGPRPAGFGKTKTMRYQYRYNAYRHYEDIPQILKEIREPTKFKKRLKRYLYNNDDLPENRNPSIQDQPRGNSQTNDK